MMTHAQVKHIQSLEAKNNRLQYRQFVVEGDKMVKELLQSTLRPITVYALASWLDSFSSLPPSVTCHEIEPHVLKRISFLTTPNQVLALAPLPQPVATTFDKALLLDGIQDPGNLGSIIRIADWYGIPAVYTNTTCADVFHPKVVQASMGSIFRVNLLQQELLPLLQDPDAPPSYAAVLGGADINTCPAVSSGYLVIGSEARGLQPAISAACTQRVSIQPRGKAESLNAAVATGILCHRLFY